MKKYQFNANSAVYMAIVSAMTLVWVITLFLQNMWYEKKANTFVAGRQYEDEKITWPGHKLIHHLPVEYPQNL